ncbi:hypothetical protein G9A89_011614 [Geosiphon pyriformis]|nr:hypothetical protein G9A89_011614 [Geosiphon pyriformis]
MKQIGKLAKRLNLLMLAVFQPSPGCQLLITPFSQNLKNDIVMKVGSSETTGGETAIVLDSSVFLYVIKLENMLEGLSASVLSLSACFDSLVLAGGNLISIFTESKLKKNICLWITNRFDGIQVFTSGLESGYLSAGVVVIIDLSLARHVSRVSEMPGRLLSIKLLFKNKVSVSILGLYTGASSVTANKSFFVILGGNFNEDGSHKCANFKKCANLGLVNSLVGSLAIKEPTWTNSRGIIKTIDFIFILEVGEYFDTDHKAVFMFVGLGGFLDTWLNSFCKQANKNQWKFNFKDAGENKWNNFKGATMANMAIFSNKFATASRFSDLNTILELLVSKIVRSFLGGGVDNFVSLMEHWCSLNNLVNSDVFCNCVHSVLSGARKSYHALKLVESLRAKEANIRSTIDKRIKSFEINKDYTIKSVLECPFHKVVLDHLVVDDKLVLEPGLVKSKPLEYVFDGAFSGVIYSIDFDEFFGVVFNLPNNKAAGLSGISNEL